MGGEDECMLTLRNVLLSVTMAALFGSRLDSMMKAYCGCVPFSSICYCRGELQ
jgi:hypothetical protein